MHITKGVTSHRAKPTDDQIDIYAVTHQGKVRAQNQDHFLVGQLKKQMEVMYTSLSNVSVIPADQERLALFAMVADGVGGHAGGEEASRLAVKEVTRYLSESIHVYLHRRHNRQQRLRRGARSGRAARTRSGIGAPGAKPRTRQGCQHLIAIDRRLAEGLSRAVGR